MERTGDKQQCGRDRGSRPGTDRLTGVLVAASLFLVAAIAALGADLWLRPGNESAAVYVQASPTARPSPSPTGQPTQPSPGLLPSRTPAPTPSPAPTPPAAAVRLRIPSIGVDRSIVELALTYDSRSRNWQRDYDQLFRSGKNDLVGHFDGSALPGQPGNTILVGHNYGYGVSGVFVRLGRLKVGQQVEVVTDAGQTFTFKVTQVTRLAWSKKNQRELLQHQPYLSVDGPERLTLVTCGGSSWAPFPERVYVVAAPAH